MELHQLVFSPFMGAYKNDKVVFTGLVFSEYLLSGQVPLVKEVNDEEPLFPAIPVLNMKQHVNMKQPHKLDSACLSEEAKGSAAEVERRLDLGSKLSDIVQ
ncbi:hypothetical protein Droror1_Dr00025946 [Drosera rotundifolia]